MRGQWQSLLNAVVSKSEHIERLKLAVEHLHKCGAHHQRTVSVHEKFNGETVWQGDVEVFGITGHQKAQRCYAWSHLEGDDDSGERFVAVLEIPPVESAETAVRVQIVKDRKTGYAK